MVFQKGHRPKSKGQADPQTYVYPAAHVCQPGVKCEHDEVASVFVQCEVCEDWLIPDAMVLHLLLAHRKRETRQQRQERQRKHITDQLRKVRDQRESGM